jgi:hypothetical protein
VLIVDAGALYAAAARRDRHHRRCVELLTGASWPLLVPTLDHRHFATVEPRHVERFTLAP